MPELPEVETVVNAIKKSLKSITINRFIIMNNKLRWKIDSDISNSVKDQEINLIYRRGKHIIFKLDDGYLLIHLGMTGIIKFRDSLSSKDIEKHDHYEIQFKDNKILRYNDIRKFGSIHWTQDIDNHFLIQNLGPEPLSKEFNGVFLKSKCRKRNVAIKNLIMNQNIVVGVGNIYACESLYLSSIRPEKKCKYITLKQCNDLAKAIKYVLKKSIKSGGTTLKDFKTLDGTPGYFKQKLMIYDCKICKCGAKVKNIKLGGRSSFYCNICQK